MNKAVTEGFVLMPRAFAAGLSHWSSGDGRPGNASYQGASNALLVTNDADFGACLELNKTESVQKLRAFTQTPLHPDMYLRLRVRLKAISGNLPEARLALWAGNSSGSAITNVQLYSQSVALTAYGTIVTCEAILGSGRRNGVDIALGQEAAIAQIGLDLTGATGGVVRIESFSVEDVTSIYLRDLMDVVDVRDYGAIGDGVANDFAAFQAADAAAQGRTIMVSAGTYRITGNLTINNPIRFSGKIVQGSGHRIVLTRNYDLETYSRAYGSDIEGFKRAFQALFYFTDHVTLDMSGRRVELDGPLNIADLSGQTNFATRRVLRNGSFSAVSSGNWNNEQAVSVGTYTPSQNPTRLTGVANVANIPIGALVIGNGVGREVYVKSKNVAAGTVELSQPLYGGSGTRNYTFRRFKYMLDFGGFESLSRFELQDIEFNCLGLCSGVMLAQAGLVFGFDKCTFNRPKDRGITSTGTGCQGMFVDQCQFLSNEQALPAPDRTTIALNIQANDVKVRNNRIVRFRHFAVINGTSHMIYNNHFFQGDDQTAGVRLAGLIFTQTNVATVMQGNYIDNCFIEWGNEHDADPDFNAELSFGGLSLNGNMFIASHVSSAFRWLVVKPYGQGHFLNGFTMVNNTFRVFNATIDRVEKVDTSVQVLDFTRTRNVRVEGNTYNQVTNGVLNPIVSAVIQNTASENWSVNVENLIPFGARIRMVESIQPEGAIQNANGVNKHILPYSVPTLTGANIRWGEAVKGKAIASLRMDIPS